MKLLGTGTFDANVTTTTNSLAAALLTSPDISMNISNLYEKNFSAFSSYLARKGLIKGGLFPDFSSDNFQVIGNRKFKWSLKGYPFRKGAIAATVTSPAGYTNMGQYGSEIILPLNTNYFSPNDVLELADQRTHIVLMNEYPKEAPNAPGVWLYRAKLTTSVDTDYIPAGLLAVGSEVGFSHTLFPEMSETGYEKNTFPEWHANTMTIQRMAYSISGSADATILWLEHNGQKLWMFTQDREMLRRWAQARENQLIFGKRTVDLNTDVVLLKDLKNRELVSGDGLLASADGSLKFQYNKLTVKIIENLMQNLQLSSNDDGDVEVLVIAGQKFVWDFSKILTDVFKYNPLPLFTGSGSNKGVDATFTSYSRNGVKFVTAWNKAFDAPWRPQKTDIYGNTYGSQRAIFVGLNTTMDSPNCQLVTLGGKGRDRSFVKKFIGGMASPTGADSGRMEMASNSMDGYQVQILSETGLKLNNPYSVAELYKPMI